MFAIAMFTTLICFSNAAPTQLIEDEELYSYFWCDGKPADIFFLLDSSTSIWPNQFTKQLNFVQNIVQSFPISAEETRVGVGSFATIYRTDITFDRYSNVSELTHAIGDLKQLMGNTNTAEALEILREDVFLKARQGAAHLAVILTDGESMKKKETKYQAKLLKDTGVAVFTIGIGNKINEELRVIGSEPSSFFVHEVASFDALDNIKNSIRETLAFQICKVELPKYQPYCSANMETDVMFVFDAFGMGARKTRHVKSFVGDLVSKFGNMDDKTLQAGVFSGFCAERISIDLDDYSNKEELASAISNSDMKGLDQMVNQLYKNSYSEARGGRHTARRIAVIFVDESVEKLDNFISEVQAAKGKADLEVFIVAVGENLDNEMLAGVASLPRDQHFISVTSHQDLDNIKANYIDKFCNIL